MLVSKSMVLALGILALISSTLGLITQALRKAPLGYEDDHGFHLSRKAPHQSGAQGSGVTRTRRAVTNQHRRAQPAVAG